MITEQPLRTLGLYCDICKVVYYVVFHREIVLNRPRGSCRFHPCQVNFQ